MTMNQKNNRGYIALISILIVSVVIMTVSVSVVLLSVSEGQLALSNQLSQTALNLGEACVEEALLKINNDNVLPAEIVLPDGTCSAQIISQIGADWDFTITAVKSGYTRKFQIQALRAGVVSLNRWQEIEP